MFKVRSLMASNTKTTTKNMLNRTNNFILQRSRNLLVKQHRLRAIGIFLLLMLFVGSTIQAGLIYAESVDELRNRTSELEDKIEQNEEHAENMHARANTLKEELSNLSYDITEASDNIQTTEANIVTLKGKLEKANKELDRQKKILKANMRTLYMRAGASPVEMLVAAESFSQFIDEQEYLERIKASVQESTEKVIKLRKEIKTKKRKQEKLKVEQERQRGVLALKKQQQQSLLKKTQGQEAKYKAIVEKLEKQQAEAEAALIAALSSGSFKSAPVGYVAAGDVIGQVGNSGLSSGPHLHLEVRKGSSVVSPWPYIKSRPVISSYITQDYGVRNPIYYSGYHPGIDYSAGDGYVRAIDSGNMYRGCSNSMLGTTTNPYGYVAIIEHVGGHYSIYAHMAGGPGACNYNTYW